MKMTRTSRLNALTPGLILALLLFSACNPKTDQTSVTASPTPGQSATPTAGGEAVQVNTLEGTEKEEVATTTAPKGVALGRPEKLTGKFTEFSLPQGTFPQLMATARDGSIYYAQGLANKVGRIASPSSADSGKLTVQDYPVPTANSFPIGIVVGPDDNVWFTEKNGHKIGKLNTKSNVITEYATPTANSGPVGIAVGPDNNIWFTEADANKIGKLDPNNPQKIEEFSIGTSDSSPLYITTGPDRALWFAEVKGHKIGRIDPGTYAITEFSTRTPKSGPACIITGPDNALWVSELNADKIARFDVESKRFTDEIPLASHKNGPRAGPGILVSGPDGNIWFTEMYGNQIGRINPKNKQIHEFSAPSTAKLAVPGPPPSAAAANGKPAWRDENIAAPPPSDTGGPGSIVVGQDGSLWYTAMFSNKIARLQTRKG
jgi:virginiamycin B lyase